MPQIVKTDGVREDFSTAKLRTGFQRALHKRPVTTELVDAAITRIEQKMLALGEREIDSRRLGEMVMEELRKLDKVAYIRFASVYKSFSDVEDFRDAIREVKDKKFPRQQSVACRSPPLETSGTHSDQQRHR